tara:strand:- start:1455 stop:2348 length:894 start_codon:yes stop_codon:yes gene_type:complete
MKLLFLFAKRFIAGYDFASAIPVIQKLMDDGYKVSVDYLGELSETEEDCERAYQQYLEIVDYYKNNKIDISIKPSQLGLKINKNLCQKFMGGIVGKAFRNGLTIRLDMEDDSLIEDTIDLCLRLHKFYPNTGCAIQTNMYRTKDDLTKLLQNKVSIRLVKGAYRGNNKIAYQNKKQIENLFLKQSLQILSDRCRSYYHLKDKRTPIHAIGTHDNNIIKQIIHYSKTINIKKEDFDFEFLYGIRRDIQTELLDSGYNVRLYVPFGQQWLPYTLRRLKEFKNLKFVFLNIFREFFSKRP